MSAGAIAAAILVGLACFIWARLGWTAWRSGRQDAEPGGSLVRRRWLFVAIFAAHVLALGGILGAAGDSDELVGAIAGALVLVDVAACVAAVRYAVRAVEQVRASSVSADYVSKMIQSMINTVIAVRADFTIDAVNEATCMLLGYTRAEMIGMPMDRICPVEELFQVIGVANLVEGRPITPVERIYRAKNGSRIPVLFSGSIINDDATGSIRAIVCVAVDITERKQMEQALADRARDLEEANEQLKELDKLKDSFLSTVSHELRTPLTSIKGAAEILQNYGDEDKATRTEFLGIISSESERLIRLVNDVLDLAKIEAGRMQWNETEAPIWPIIESAVNTAKVLAAQHNQTIQVHGAKDLPNVWADRDRIIQVVTNLLSNAVKFTPAGGQILVQAGLAKSITGANGIPALQVSVTDSGIGIAPENHAKVFEKFRQVGDTLTDRPKGTGLGLPICREIIEHHGGKIWVESTLGKGATFTFTLPLKPPARPDPTPVEEPRTARAE